MLVDKDTFQNPDVKYRGLPFWGWNGALNKDIIKKQIGVFRQMGFGGFVIHVREGFEVPYLEKEFMDMVRFSISEAKKEGLKVWLYDEDRFPSGNAGGYVTQNPQYRQKFITFTKTPKSDGKEIGRYHILLNSKGELEKYGNMKGELWYVYLDIAKSENRYNGFTGVDVMCPEAIDEFIEITHEAYKKAVGEDFAGAVPVMFTDEPQTFRKSMIKKADCADNQFLPWTDDFAETFSKKYGFDILDFLPELIWELPDGKASRARYCYHDHVCDRFTDCFMAKCGKWCEENELVLAGHLLQEETLFTQSMDTGDVMRSYVHFGLPGMDLLCDGLEYATAKQVQSVVHQYAKQGMLSELYGVTNWDFDFRGHKFQGDWQAALGVTVRVPHHTWMWMKGPAKRDYPASIGIQSPWYSEYSYVEDHFARLNSIMSRGKAVVRIGVIHPIESFWLHWGTTDLTNAERTRREKEFADVIEWLLFGLQDFDFINEALLEKEPEKITDMGYDAIIVPDCETLRESTLNFLEEFIRSGAKVLFLGNKPKYINAQSVNCGNICPDAYCVDFTQKALMDFVEPYRIVDIISDGKRSDSFIYQMRSEGDDRWLFIAHGKKTPGIKSSLEIHIKGMYIPDVYNTVTGEISDISYECRNGETVVFAQLYDCDSLLLGLEKTDKESAYTIKQAQTATDRIVFDITSFSMCEPNVLLLDMAEYSIDDGEYEGAEEILRINEKCRIRKGLPPTGERLIQPWCHSEERERIYGRVVLKFRINCDRVFDGISLAFEEAEKIILNGVDVPIEVTGHYVDEAFKTIKLPTLMKGENILLVSVPYGYHHSIERMYMLGEFSVKLRDGKVFLEELSKTLEFGSVTKQGMPFYGGNITYISELSLDEDCMVEIEVLDYKGAFVKVSVDGKHCGIIAYAPYKLGIRLNKGIHKIELTLSGNRHNTFGALHNCGKNIFCGPMYWSSKGENWTYDYILKDFGIMSTPVIKKIRNDGLITKSGVC